jgi:deoxyribose-phosphate aldolase
VTEKIFQKLELVFSGELPRREDLKRLCDRALRENVRSIAVPSGAIVLAQHFLAEGDVKISCRIGLPNGEIDGDVKRYETEFAVDAGAHEIEFVPSLARIADGDYSAVLREIRDVVESADERPVKVAVQSERWGDDELREVMQLVLDSGAQFVCTSDEERVTLLRQLCGPKFGILAAAENLADAERMIAAGANIVAIESSRP